jgi:hypothetical protein
MAASCNPKRLDPVLNGYRTTRLVRPLSYDLMAALSLAHEAWLPDSCPQLAVRFL